MVAPYSDRLPDLNWFLNIAASPGSASLTSPRKKSIGFSRKHQRRTCQQIQHLADSQSDKIDYHAMNMKPPLSYAQLIMDAMAERKVKKITLSEIYEYVSRRYAYYRSSKGPWKNSIRHNLSCNQLFKRIPRQNGEKGKGSYWTINDVSTNTHNSNKKTKTKLNELENFAAKSTSRVNSAVLQYMDSIQNRHKPIAPQDISLFDEPVSIACEDQLLSNYENNSPAESSVNVDLSDCSLADVFCLSDNHSTTYEENWHNEIPSYDLEGLPSEPFVVHIEEFHCGSIDIDPNTPPQWQDVDQYYDELVRLENEEHL